MPDQAKRESDKSSAESKATERENADLSPEELRAVVGGKGSPGKQTGYLPPVVKPNG
jgi:hypothetical protein